jgi:hypothetical protein
MRGQGVESLETFEGIGLQADGREEHSPRRVARCGIIAA